MKRLITVLTLCVSFFIIINAQTKKTIVVTAKQINPTTIEILYSNNNRLSIDFYGNNIFRMFQDNNGGIIRNPIAEPPAQILVDNPRSNVNNLDVVDENDVVTIRTDEIKILIDKANALFSIKNRTDNIVLQSVRPFEFTSKSVSWTLKADKDEYFYGGGVQNGRFSHKGKIIAIENQNSWTDSGVASPNPYYWSTKGYGIMWHTFKKGQYDFDSKRNNEIIISHDTDYLDLFVMINDGAVPLLNDFYQLTGKPVLLPKFGFYEGHLNAYNRDYWKEDANGILYEDGKKYKESQKDNGGIKESLNGELNNYQFSARAVIDRYKAYDMPLGWLLPNDGYGAGYGQTETLDGNIANLKSLADYANKNGVEIGLWTQSDLHPKPEISALLQRDIVKEVRDAKVRVLKTDVAWVGAGYSFGLNGVADVAQIMPYYGNNARPFIISLDGWAGTQRYAGIWSGDQTGGNWEYIRFHIPTYIGSGLSGNPNISSDMDGIFGGKNEVVNIRDFQWKTFTPMQLNMDGWGSNPKYPHILGEPATSINRHYLKLKAELMPYAYSLAREAVDGLPMIRAMFLEYPNSYTFGKATQYQFLFGKYFLIAPIYQNTKADAQGNDVRNGIYLPEGIWYDYFTGQKYTGNRIINSYQAPIWKLPIFVKEGAIIPMNNPHNNPTEIDKSLIIIEIYPSKRKTEFMLYDDDGLTEAYKKGSSAVTHIVSQIEGKDKLVVNVKPTVGNFDGMVTNQRTELKINVSKKTKKILVKANHKPIKIREVYSEKDFVNGENVYFYNSKVNLNRFATKGADFEKVEMIKNPQLWIKIAKKDITKTNLEIEVSGVEFEMPNTLLVNTGALSAPNNAKVADENREAYTLTPTWDAVSNADYYEIEFNGMNYSMIRDTKLLFEELVPETEYEFQLRAVNKSGVSEWTKFSVTTKSNPLEFAIRGVEATATCVNQGGQEIDKMFNFDEGDMWHTDWSKNALPFDIVIDLNTVNQLDKIHYLPRQEGMNGLLYGGNVFVSNDKTSWTKAGEFAWERDNNVKVFTFDDKPTARYIKISVMKGVGGFGSGREMYIFKVPGTESYIPGDINHDRLVDMNDFTSYLNYTGLRQGDADFEGYVSKGDLNRNGLIDAYDISVVATQLDGGIELNGNNTSAVNGNIVLKADKKSYKAGDVAQILVKGEKLSAVNALSFALDYNPLEYEYLGVEKKGVGEMENMTNDRLHTNRVKALYPTFVNIGDKPILEGSIDLFVIKLKVKKNITFGLTIKDLILVDKGLNVKQ